MRLLVTGEADGVATCDPGVSGRIQTDRTTAPLPMQNSSASVGQRL